MTASLHLTTRTAPLPVLCTEHGWCTESRHATSLGTVLYQRCVRCGTRRVDLLPVTELVPIAASHEVDAASATAPRRRS